MILNSGLNNMAAYPGTNVGQSGDGGFSGFIQYAAVGTGVSAPDVTDTALESESLRTSATGGFGSSVTQNSRDPVENTYTFTQRITRVFNISTAANFTEWGFVPVSSSGAFSIRDLFREDPNDPMSNPIVISVQPGDQLQLWLFFTVQTPWVIEPGVLTVETESGPNSHDMQAGWYASANADWPGQGFWSVAWPGNQTNINLRSGAAAQNPDRSVAFNRSGGSTASASAAAYVPGTFERDLNVVMSTAAGNHTWTGFEISGNTAGMGWKLVFNAGHEMTKTNLERFELTFTRTWGRL